MNTGNTEGYIFTPGSTRNRYNADRFILVNKYRIHYLDIGQGKPVLLVPSSYRTYSIWQKLIEVFPEGYRLIALDHAGIESLRNLRYIIDQDTQLQSDIIAGMIKQMNLGEVILTGGFYGGSIVFDLAARYPGLVEKIVLIEGDLAAPEFKIKLPHIYSMKLPGDISFQITRLSSKEKHSEHVTGARWYTELLPDGGNLMKPVSGPPAKKHGHKIPLKIELVRGKAKSIEEVARSIKKPLLYLFGTKARFRKTLLEKNLALLKKCLPQAWIIAMEGNLSDYITDRPSEIAGLILEFLSQKGTQNMD